MSRVKTFDSTGTAPNGRLFAGDLNAIQDQYADLFNLAQSLGVSAIAIGEGGLQLLRFGTGEARISGAFRTDGIVRALGGLFTGTFTTAQRDAIAAGFRPFGLEIFNTTTNRREINLGSDAVPNWQPVSPPAVEIPIGMIAEWPWAAASLPSWALLPFGQAISRTTYATLAALASAAAYVYGNGDGSTTFNLPDERGRVTVGKDDMGGSAANRITAAISGVAGTQLGAVFGVEGITLTTAQMPAHTHSFTTGNVSADHTHSGSTGGRTAGHIHDANIDDPADLGGVGNTGPGAANSARQQNPHVSLGGETTDHGHNFTTGGISANHTHSGTTAATGSGSVVQNSQPSIVVNKLMRVL